MYIALWIIGIWIVGMPLVAYAYTRWFADNFDEHEVELAAMAWPFVVLMILLLAPIKIAYKLARGTNR